MIYLDNNATTQLDPEVVVLMQKELLRHGANPSSIHAWGRESKARVTAARRQIASCFACLPQEVLFHSGATEGLNTLILGSLKSGDHVVLSAVEHPAVEAPISYLEKRGVEVTRLSVGMKGCVSPEDLERACRENTALIAIQAVNSETGVINDLEALSHIALRNGIPFVVDGVAALGKIPFKWYKGISACCFSGHKIHAPPGIGFTLCRSTFRFTSLIFGGGQEYGKRSGSENVIGIVALGRAVESAILNLEENAKKMGALRDYFEAALLSPHIKVNGQGKRVCNTSNLCFSGVDGETLLMKLDGLGVAASLGSACSAGALEPSRTLLQMGLSQGEALSSLRFSLSRFTTREEIDKALIILKPLFSF